MALTIPSFQATGGFTITPSDSTDIIADPGNATLLITFCYVHISGTSGVVKVDTVDGQTLTLYGVQGNVLGGNMPVLVKRVWATPAPPTAIALRGKVSYQ